MCDLGPTPALHQASGSKTSPPSPTPCLPSWGFLSQGCGLAAFQVCSVRPVSPQGAYSTFVYSYAVEKPLSVGHKVAGYLPSLFWGFITLGQLVSIPISSKVKPATMVFINVVSGLLLLLGDPGELFTTGPTTTQDFCSGLCQWGGTVGEEGRKLWIGEGCWWGRDGSPGSGAYPCDLGKVPFSLWASDFVPIKGRGCRR